MSRPLSFSNMFTSTSSLGVSSFAFLFFPSLFLQFQPLLSDAVNSQDVGVIPSLRTRFKLARYLANALYQLQCSNWLHRNLSSHQVVFFHDKEAGSLLLDQPYLIGFQYSRPDDNIRIEKEKFEFSEGIDRNENLPELYLSPIFSRRQQRWYRRSNDVYSTGIMLFEAAF